VRRTDPNLGVIFDETGAVDGAFIQKSACKSLEFNLRILLGMAKADNLSWDIRSELTWLADTLKKVHKNVQTMEPAAFESCRVPTLALIRGEKDPKVGGLKLVPGQELINDTDDLFVEDDTENPMDSWDPAKHNWIG
jgi:hypothetical protein